MGIKQFLIISFISLFLSTCQIEGNLTVIVSPETTPPFVTTTPSPFAANHPSETPKMESVDKERVEEIFYTTQTAQTAPKPSPKSSHTPDLQIVPTSQPAHTLAGKELIYTTQSGDSLEVIAIRFDVLATEITCAEPGTFTCPREIDSKDTGESRTPSRHLIEPGSRLLIPKHFNSVGPDQWILPDSEVVYTVSAVDFDTAAYLETAGGYLSSHRQYLMVTGWNTGADIVNMVANENSINPRLLLALLEYQCGCILGNPGPLESIEPFMKVYEHKRKDLYGQLEWLVYELSIGYYGWREGTLLEIQAKDGRIIRLAPHLNAGTAAIQYIFAQLYDLEQWKHALDIDEGFPALYRQMFGDPWERALTIFPINSNQPHLQLPFEAKRMWSFTGGPHPAFEGNGPLASLDFAPASTEAGCIPSDAWVVASTDGLVVRSSLNVVVLDLDGDGLEQTGWNLMYLHLESRHQVPVGTYLKAGDPIGHPSCEGGFANGTHVHIARKFNGEWIPADGPLPFNLSGWITNNGSKPYLGTLTKGDQVVTACTCSWPNSWIMIEDDEQ